MPLPQLDATLLRCPPPRPPRYGCQASKPLLEALLRGSSMKWKSVKSWWKYTWAQKEMQTCSLGAYCVPVRAHAI